MGEFFTLEEVVRRDPCNHCDDNRYEEFGESSEVDCIECEVPMHVSCYEEKEKCDTWGCSQNYARDDFTFYVEPEGITHKVLKAAHSVTGPLKSSVQKYWAFMAQDDTGVLQVTSSLVNLVLFSYAGEKIGAGYLAGLAGGVIDGALRMYASRHAKTYAPSYVFMLPLFPVGLVEKILKNTEAVDAINKKNELNEANPVKDFP